MPAAIFYLLEKGAARRGSLPTARSLYIQPDTGWSRLVTLPL